MRLSDSIEQFIKEMLTAEEASVELKRNELAAYFGCAPSQINYVLSTRFTPDEGYVTESRRGGGGYIRIVRVVRSPKDQLQYLLNERIGQSITYEDSVRLIACLVSSGGITREAGEMMRAATSPLALSLPLSTALKNAQRASILRAMVMEAVKQQGTTKGLCPLEPHQRDKSL